MPGRFGLARVFNAGQKTFGLLAALFVLPLHAQLSPGELHQSHAFLEGLKNCTRCHSSGNRISPDKCLACHVALKERIQANQGLHARQEYRNCVDCHSDHHGRNFEMIFWKGGQENFDHSQTGYPLEGAHARQECRACHRGEHIAGKARLLEQKISLKRTFLGLNRDCLSCHVDEHRGQVGKECLNCHEMEKWKPAPKFDHARARFTLTGRHLEVACEKCHTPVTDNRFPNDAGFLKFKLPAFARCADCHEDFHRGSLGENCQTCHSTAGWQSGAFAGFDHGKTRFPLLGKHQSVKCESCHQPGKPRRGLAFANCRDCHNDYHRGQFAARSSKGACEECHTVNGFSPSTFSLDAHQQTDFPLKGAHLAIPCVACHAGGGNGGGQNRSMLKINRFTFNSTRCQDCHKDPHRGEVDRYTQTGGCEHCHSVESWRKIHFDHGQTRFALAGRHREIACNACHRPTSSSGEEKRPQLTGLPLLCQDCHEDIHQGQFQTATVSAGKTVNVTDCSRCHTPSRWQPELFDHNRHSKFPLEGAHRSVPCRNCHPREERNGVVITVFKPLSGECSACHGENSSKRRGTRQ